MDLLYSSILPLLINQSGDSWRIVTSARIGRHIKVGMKIAIRHGRNAPDGQNYYYFAFLEVGGLVPENKTIQNPRECKTEYIAAPRPRRFVSKISHKNTYKFQL